MTEEEAETQLGDVAAAVREAVLGLLRANGAHPRLVVLAVAQVAGELGAGDALATGGDVGETLGALADMLRQAGEDHHEMLRAVSMPVAGSA